MKLPSAELVGGTRALPEDGHRSGNLDKSLSTTQRFAIGLEGFIALCGLGGGGFMMAHPLTAMSLRYLRGTWFHTWRWPGIALLFFVGICPVLVLVAALRQYRLAALGPVVVGLGLVAWIVLEAAWIVVNLGLQLAVGAIGAAILVLGIHEIRAESLSLQRIRPSR